MDAITHAQMLSTLVSIKDKVDEQHKVVITQLEENPDNTVLIEIIYNGLSTSIKAEAEEAEKREAIKKKGG